MPADNLACSPGGAPARAEQPIQMPSSPEVSVSALLKDMGSTLQRSLRASLKKVCQVGGGMGRRRLCGKDGICLLSGVQLNTGVMHALRRSFAVFFPPLLAKLLASAFRMRFCSVAARSSAWLKPLPPPSLQGKAPQNEAEQWLHDLQTCMRRTVVVAEVRWTWLAWCAPPG